MLIVIGSGANAQAPLKLRVAGIPIDVGALSYYADQEGFFKKHGLDVDVITGQNGAAVAAAVAGGSLDIGDGNTTSVALAHQGGIPFVFIAPSGAYTSKAPTSALLVLKTSPIKSAKDLASKVIGIAGLKSLGEVAARAWLEKNGVPSDSAKYLELTYSQMGPGLESGRIDAALAEEPAVATLLDSNARVLARPYDILAPEFLEGGYFATSDFVRAHPDVIKQFADAMAETAIWANAHHAETAAILNQVSKTTLSPNVVRISYPPRVTPALIQPLLDASAKYGLLKSTYPASEIIAPGVGP
ncbi:MAG: ABC transporter substrate-binding protein [Candidatus Lustribacter sp.]